MFYTPKEIAQQCQLPVEVVIFLAHQALRGAGPFPAPSFAELRPAKKGDRMLWDEKRARQAKKIAHLFHATAKNPLIPDYLSRAQAARHHGIKPPAWDYRKINIIPPPDYIAIKTRVKLWHIKTVEKYKKLRKK